MPTTSSKRRSLERELLDEVMRGAECADVEVVPGHNRQWTSADPDGRRSDWYDADSTAEAPMVQLTLPAFVGQANLQVVVRQILKSDSAEITDCAHNLLYGGLGTAEGRNSVHRLTGLARVEDDVVPWSVVLKRVGAPSSGAPAADLGHPDYWKREALTFAVRPAGHVARRPRRAHMLQRR